MIYIIIYSRIAVEVFGRHLGVVDTILSTTLSFLLKMCYNLVYYFFIPVLIKDSLYIATRKQIRWTNVKEEKMNKIIMKIVALVCVTVLAGLIVLLTKDILAALILEIIVLYYCFKDINKD